MRIYDSSDDTPENDPPVGQQDVTLKQLMDAVKDEADMTGSSFLNDNQLIRWINVELSELYDLLIGSYSDYFVAVEAGSAVIEGGLLRLPGNMYKLLAMHVKNGGDFIRVKRMNLADYDRFYNSNVSIATGESYRYRLLGTTVVFLPAPAVGTEVQLFYIPQLGKMTKPEDRVHCLVPIGWEDFVVAGAAARALAKEESDNSYQLQRKAYIRQHIVEMAGRDESSGDSIRDVYRRFDPDSGYMDVDE